MIKTLMLFPKSTDLKALEKELENPGRQVRQAHGFRSQRQSVGDIMSPMGPPPFSKVIETSFDSLEDVVAFGQSPAAQGSKDYLKDLGAIMLIYELSDS